MTKRYKEVFRLCLMSYPWIEEQIVDWYDYGYFTIRVLLNDGRAIEFDGQEEIFAIRNSLEALDNMHRGDTEEKWRLEFSRRLYKKLNRSGYIQSELAEAAGISQASIASYVNGLKVPSAYNLKKIAEVLGCTTDSLINF